MAKRMGRTGGSLVMTALVSAVLCGWAEAEILEQIYARVGDAIILKSEFEIQEKIMLQQLKTVGQPGVDEETSVERRKELLNNMINETLLLQRAEELGIKATENQIDDFVESIKQQNNIATQDELLAALRLEGLTYEGLRKSLAKRIAIETIKQQEIYANIVTTEEELKAYYEEHKEEYREEERIRLGEIVLLFDPEKPKEETRLEAFRVYDLLLKGADFAELATFVSQTPSREHGGDLGFIERGMLATEIEKVAYSLKPGEISKPVRTKFGYHILKLVGQKGQSYRSFEEVKPRIQQILREEKFQKHYQEYMGDLRNESYLEILVPELSGAAGQEG